MLYVAQSVETPYRQQSGRTSPAVGDFQHRHRRGRVVGKPLDKSPLAALVGRKRSHIDLFELRAVAVAAQALFNSEFVVHNLFYNFPQR